MTSGESVLSGIVSGRSKLKLSIITKVRMLMNKMRPIHPGEVLRKEFLEPLELSAHALSIALRVPAPRINDLARERRSVTPDTALRLARYFKTTPQFWMNLQASYDLKVALRESKGRIDKEVMPHAA